jgi:hypothetical protein
MKPNATEGKQSDALPASRCRGRDVFFHGKSGGPAIRFAGAAAGNWGTYPAQPKGQAGAGNLATALLGAPDRGGADLERHVDYIHFNPVKHSWVSRAVDWLYSTLQRDVDRDWISPDWGGEGKEDGETYGEW